MIQSSTSATPLTLTVDGLDIAALRWGNTGHPPILALHGWLDNAASFIPLAPLLASGHEVVALDLPGHGLSGWLADPSSYALPWLVHRLLSCADALDWPRFTLLGHSMGGALASLMAAGAPERINHLISLDALGPLASTPDTAIPRFQRHLAALGKTAHPLRTYPDQELMVERRRAVTPMQADSARLLVNRGSHRRDTGWQWSSDPGWTCPTPIYLAESQVHALLESIRCPVTVIAARDGLVANRPDFQNRLDCLQHGRLVMTDGQHHTHMDDPQAVADIVLDALTNPASN